MEAWAIRNIEDSKVRDICDKLDHMSLHRPKKSAPSKRVNNRSKGRMKESLDMSKVVQAMTISLLDSGGSSEEEYETYNLRYQKVRQAFEKAPSRSICNTCERRGYLPCCTINGGYPAKPSLDAMINALTTNNAYDSSYCIPAQYQPRIDTFVKENRQRIYDLIMSGKQPTIGSSAYSLCLSGRGARRRHDQEGKPAISDLRYNNFQPMGVRPRRTLVQSKNPQDVRKTSMGAGMQRMWEIGLPTLLYTRRLPTATNMQSYNDSYQYAR